MANGGSFATMCEAAKRAGWENWKMYCGQAYDEEEQPASAAPAAPACSLDALVLGAPLYGAAFTFAFARPDR